ncbi:hypothetical protein BDV95DRAFT_605105 [Massariosphaeria phaeospora]|uniref:DUF7730 domain-containing protein n=1 Tax=Massariosphaeria phaeospora TaxID=100035 RepID=A0A7C8MAZ1_9PLEO|nr:hypothetical protein BDV95DRAFT_605105 [Massariosphaeria phaeospora]
MKEPMQEQSQASFFKLPTELKNIIYEMVLCETGCVYVQATDIPGDELKLESRVCKKPEGGSRPCYRTCFATKPWSARLLSLALVCQRMYRETINMLYSGNAFVFQTQMDFAIFSQSVLPQRLHSIRNMVMGSSILESHSPQLRDAYLQLSKGVNEFEILRSMESLKGVDYYMSCDLQQLDDAASSGSSTWAIYLSR